MRTGEIDYEDIVIGKVLQRVSLSIRSRKRETRSLVADVQGREPVGQVFGVGGVCEIYCNNDCDTNR